MAAGILSFDLLAISVMVKVGGRDKKEQNRGKFYIHKNYVNSFFCQMLMKARLT